MNYPFAFSNKFPAMLKKHSPTLMDFTSDGPLAIDDEIEYPSGFLKSENKYVFRTAVITKVVEQRPAKGDWSGDRWKGTTPTWQRCKTSTP